MPDTSAPRRGATRCDRRIGASPRQPCARQSLHCCTGLPSASRSAHTSATASRPPTGERSLRTRQPAPRGEARGAMRGGGTVHPAHRLTRTRTHRRSSPRPSRRPRAHLRTTSTHLALPTAKNGTSETLSHLISPIARSFARPLGRLLRCRRWRQSGISQYFTHPPKR
jgi:hypothetical protein